FEKHAPKLDTCRLLSAAPSILHRISARLRTLRFSSRWSVLPKAPLLLRQTQPIGVLINLRPVYLRNEIVVDGRWAWNRRPTHGLCRILHLDDEHLPSGRAGDADLGLAVTVAYGPEVAACAVGVE